MRPPGLAGQVPTYASWVAACRENEDGGGTATLQNVWRMMLANVPSEWQQVGGAASRDKLRACGASAVPLLPASCCFVCLPACRGLSFHVAQICSPPSPPLISLLSPEMGHIMVEAVVLTYPTPIRLYRAYQVCAWVPSVLL